MEVTSLSYSQQMFEKAQNFTVPQTRFKHDSPFSNDVSLRERNVFYSGFLRFHA